MLAAASAAAALLIGGSGCPASVDVLEGASAQHRAIEAIDLPQTVGVLVGALDQKPLAPFPGRAVEVWVGFEAGEESRAERDPNGGRPRRWPRRRTRCHARRSPESWR